MDKLQTAFAIFGVVVGAASAIIALLPPAKEGSKYAKFVALVDKLSIFYAKYKKK
ncbi:MAG: hypothetical protein J6S85_03960 [Methanobrevibacter sp.]|nr:hypothetical protein [Methanobrevibacter sp.]MBO7712698.1 hypothetical protein [Methanobrevibacter sp.]